MQPIVEIENLSKSFGKRVAVNCLSFAIEKGEIFGLLGHNGAGKSTTFGMMLGHVTPDSGTVRLRGHAINTEREAALQLVGAIFETPAFYDYMSGWANLCYFVALTGATPQKRMREVIELVGLSQRIHEPVRTYSHGMRQRLALAQALLPRPSFLLLDEPTEGLDPQGIHEMRELILSLRRDHGLTVLLASHLLSEVEQLCDRVAILHQGNLVFCGQWQSSSAQYALDIDDWARAEPLFAQCGVVVNSAGHIELPEDLAIADLVATLVQLAIRVSQVRPVRQTLEEFYLSHSSHYL